MAVEAPRVRMRPYMYHLTAPIGEAEGAETLAGLRCDLGAWLGDHPRRDDAITVVTELVENAFVHGSEPGGRVRLEVERLDGDRLTVRVRDEGRTASQAPRVTTPPGFGHGLRIVSGLCAEFDLTESGGGMTALAILAATPPPIAEPAIGFKALLDAYPDGPGQDDDLCGPADPAWETGVDALTDG